MNLDAVVWVLLPVFIAGGSALLSFYIMQARMEVAVAKERESLAEANALINSSKVILEERIKATEQATRRQALDDFMQEFRVEERQYLRENKTAEALKKSMILQERLYFRNIPLSSWVEHELLMEDNISMVDETRRVFLGPKSIPDDGSVIRMPQQASAFSQLGHVS